MVHFVGAGPGGPDLITLRGAELLKQADCVVYAGSLVNPALLGFVREGVPVYNSAHMTLEQVLEVLETEGASATFFILGQNVEGHEDLVKEIDARGHLIGNHTFHHVQITSLPPDQAYDEIQQTSDLIRELTGKGTEYVRPPFGTWNEGLEDRLDLIPVMWTIDTLDWTTENVDEIVRRVTEHAEENDIILMHDGYESTVAALERFIPLLEADGFEFVTVDQVIMD